MDALPSCCKSSVHLKSQCYITASQLEIYEGGVRCYFRPVGIGSDVVRCKNFDSKSVLVRNLPNGKIGWVRAKSPDEKLLLVYFPDFGQSKLVKTEKVIKVNEFEGNPMITGNLSVDQKTDIVPIGESVLVGINQTESSINLQWIEEPRLVTVSPHS